MAHGDFPPSATMLTMEVDHVPYATAVFPGTLTYVAPGDGTVFVGWFVDTGSAPGRSTASPSSAPGDGDGVADEADECAATTIYDPPPYPKKKRYLADPHGRFVDGEGAWSGYTVADARGCDEDQIIDLLGLGNGHKKAGVNLAELQSFIIFGA